MNNLQILNNLQINPKVGQVYLFLSNKGADSQRKKGDSTASAEPHPPTRSAIDATGSFDYYVVYLMWDIRPLCYMHSYSYSYRSFILPGALSRVSFYLHYCFIGLLILARCYVLSHVYLSFHSNLLFYVFCALSRTFVLPYLALTV